MGTDIGTDMGMIAPQLKAAVATGVLPAASADGPSPQAASATDASVETEMPVVQLSGPRKPKR